LSATRFQVSLLKRKISARGLDGRKQRERDYGADSQAVSPNDEPCDYPATVHCAKCGRWFCDAHAEDEEWHPCMPQRGLPSWQLLLIAERKSYTKTDYPRTPRDTHAVRGVELALVRQLFETPRLVTHHR
jgi:hypothetical protein